MYDKYVKEKKWQREKKTRIMTIDELYYFCLKNNFCNFSSKEYGSELVVTMKGNFTKEEKEYDKHKEGMTPFVSRAFHDHINLNKSEIPEETFTENVPSSNFRPILANIIVNENGEKDFGSHDFTIEQDEDGNDKFIYQEQPVGVIDGSQTTIEYDKEQGVNRAVLRGYLYDGYCQDAIDILNRREETACSVELAIRSMSFNQKEKTLLIDDFYVTGLTLLGSEIKPGMKGSNLRIEDFTQKENVITYSNNDKLIEAINKLTNMIESFNINQKEFTEGGNGVENENFKTEVTAQEENTIVVENEETTVKNTEEETVVENTEEETVVENADSPEVNEDVEDTNSTETDTQTEETTENTNTVATENESIEDITNVTETSDKTDFSISVKYGNKEFSISLADKIYAIQDLVNATYAEVDNTYYGVEVYDEYVIMMDYWSGKYYKQFYKQEDSVFSLVGDREEMFAEFVSASELEALNEMRSNYSSIQSELAVYKKNEELADKMTVFEDEAYSAYLTTKEFQSLMKEENVLKFTKDELVEKADATLGKLVKANKTFAMNANTIENKKEKPSFFAFAAHEDKSSYFDSLLKR